MDRALNKVGFAAVVTVPGFFGAITLRGTIGKFGQVRDLLARDFVDLRCQDEVTFGQAVDFVRPNRYRDLSPTQKNVGMMSLFFGHRRDRLHEFQCGDEIREVVAFLEVVLLNHLPAAHLAG